MGKKAAVVLLVGLFVASVPLIDAQQQAKIRKIGLLATGPAGLASVGEAFSKALPELGYVQGRNIVIEYRHADNKLERLPALAEELVRLKVDVLVTNATIRCNRRQECYQDYPRHFFGRV